MAKLISQSEFAEIRVVLNDVQETFYGTQIIYKKDKNTVTRFQRDIEEQRTYVDYNLDVLVVWNATGSSAEIVRNIIGANDENVGYCNVAYDEMLQAGLVDNDKNLVTKPAEDKLIINNKEYPILGLVKIGQLWDTEVVVKILFRKDITTKNE